MLWMVVVVEKEQKISDLEILAVHQFVDLVALSNHPVFPPSQCIHKCLWTIPFNSSWAGLLFFSLPFPTCLLFLPLQFNVGNLEACYNVLVLVSIFV